MSFSSQKKKHSPSNLAPAIGLASHSQPVYPRSPHAPLENPQYPFPQYVLTLPRLPLPLANCSSLEVMHTTLHATIYMCSQHGISPQLSCRPVETLPAHVFHTVPCSPALSFWFGAGGRISVARMCKIGSMMIHYIFSTSACRIFSCQHPLQLIRASCLLVLREWTRVVVNGPRPCGRYSPTVTLVGSNLFVFGGRTEKRGFNDIWALDVNHCTFAPRFQSHSY